MSEAAFDCDVLIIGLGPVGAALGALLTAEGVSTIAVDKDVDVYPLPRAAHFDHEIMRLFQRLGVADAVLPHTRVAPVYEFRTADGQVLTLFSLPPMTASGWAAGYMFHQPAIERALRAKLAEAGPDTIRLAWTFLSMAEDSEGVTARFDTPEGPKALHARWLIGCDGASSRVRDTIGGSLDDYQFDEPWLVIDAAVDDPSRLPDINLQICDPARPTTCVLMGPGRHRWEFMLLPGETPEQALDEAFIRKLLEPWNVGDLELERRAVYRFHGLVAREWRKGRVILAGDSAHQTPPFAGQGMCAGLRDAANLSWKLAAVVRGEASDALLDTYQPEREPNARFFIELAIGMGRVVCALDPQVAAARDQAMLAQRAAGAPSAPPATPQPFAAGCILVGSPGAGAAFEQACMKSDTGLLRLDDQLGAGPWLIERGTVRRLVAGRPAERLDAGLFAPDLDAWLERNGVAAVLVRPDRCVFGSGEAAELLTAWAAAMGAPVTLAA